MNKPVTWDELPIEIQSRFLMGGMIQLENWYIDSNITPEQKNPYTDEVVDQFLDAIQKKQSQSYGLTDTWMYELLDRRDIKEKKCAIMGSISPWYESIAIHYGAIPTTFEYNTFVPESNKLKMVNVQEYFALNNPKQYDIAFSISSFEHDGLGRYGDPINPVGDFRAMTEMKSLIKKDGLLFIAIPIGVDKVVWNAHRVYGKIRLPYLFDRWEIIDQAGFIESNMNINCGRSAIYQPVFVLKNI